TFDKVHLHWNPVGRGDQLYPRTIEMFAFGGIVAPVPLVPEQLAAAYAYVKACPHGKGVVDIFQLAVYVLEDPPNVDQDEHQRLLELVQPLGETALFDGPVENMAVHIVQGHGLVAPEIKSGDHRRGDYLPIGEYPVVVLAMVHFF